MRGNGLVQSNAQQQTSTRRQASDMWVGMRTTCGETCMVVGITVGERISVFLAAPAVVERLADQIATMLEMPVAVGPYKPPHRFSENGSGQDDQGWQKPSREAARPRAWQRTRRRSTGRQRWRAVATRADRFGQGVPFRLRRSLPARDCWTGSDPRGRVGRACPSQTSPMPALGIETGGSLPSTALRPGSTSTNRAAVA